MTTGNQGNSGESQAKRPLYILRRIVIIIVIIVIGVVVARQLIKTKPKISKRPAERTASLVTVVPLQSQSQVVRLTAMGTVIPSREIVLKTPVGGEIISLDENFTPGGLLKEGSTILQIDPLDYELALQQKQRMLSDAEYASQLEQGRQDVAQREWDLLYGENGAKETESDLALRKPHLKKVQADIKAAGADLELAKLNLSRTRVMAPFNGLVLNKYVDKGAFVAPQEKLADLVGTDEYWVQISLLPDRLQWLKIPKSGNGIGSSARIIYRQNSEREGHVIRLLGDLTREGRMARLLISVPDPLGLSGKEGDLQPLIIGEYVRVEIEGKELQDVFSIPRTALRNDREIWVVTGDGKLAIRPVEIIWRDKTHVLVRDGLQNGDLLIVSNLAVPVDGMAVRVDQKVDGDTKAVQPQPKGTR
jgi:RND family efflux transporter MFP subunit